MSSKKRQRQLIWFTRHWLGPERPFRSGSLVDSPIELPLIILANLREALNESDLPFSVDILERKDASDSFLSAIKTQGLINLKSL